MGTSLLSISDTSKWRDLGARIAAAAVLIPIAMILVWLGTFWFEGAVGVLFVLMGREWVKLVHGDDRIELCLHAAAALIAAGAVHFGLGLVTLAIVACWLVSVIWRTYKNETHTLWSVVGIFYVALPAMSLVLLRADINFGAASIIWILAVVWASDTAAYFAGRIIGGKKLWPRISPKKTWAGLVGAVVFGALAGLVCAIVLRLGASVPLLLAGAIFGIIGQGGDLFESALKRSAGVKDSGRLIPGHGGILDRLDSLAAVVVAAAILGLLRGGVTSPGSGLFVW